MLSVGPGLILAGKYRVGSQLGRGGMGSVWLAEHLTLGSEVAIKVIEPAAAHDETARRRFLQEAKAAASLGGAHVVQIFDYGIEDGTPFIVMERLVGETLGQRLAREGVLEPELVSTIFTHVGRAMQKAHDAGIVHRDLKPDNVFLVGSGEELVAKVLDFGVAKAPRHDDLGTSTGALLGSPLYMSPEQAHGAKIVDQRSDLWALAVIAFQCLTGRVPFQGAGWGELIAKICRDPPPVPSTVHAVPEGFDAWFARATEHEPARRHASVREFVEELRRILVPASGAVRLVSSSPPAAHVVAATLGADANAATVDLYAPRGALESTTAAVSTRAERTPVKARRWPIVVALASLVGLGFWVRSGSEEPAPVPHPTASAVEAMPSVSVHAALAEPERPPEPAASASAAPAAPASSTPRVRPAQRAVPVPSASQRSPTDLLRERE
jgi:serine/threonine protein kinase